MPFISKEDFTSHVRQENIDTITRQDDDLFEAAVNSAVAEASGYLSRFDFETLFEAVEDERDPILVMYVKDIAKWHLVSVCNASVDLELAKERYDMAIKWLDKVQAGKIVLRNWPAVPEEIGQPNYFHITSNKKRGNYY